MISKEFAMNKVVLPIFESSFKTFREFVEMDGQKLNEFTGKFVLEYHYTCTEYTHIKNIYIFFMLTYGLSFLAQVRLLTCEYYSRSSMI